MGVDIQKLFPILTNLLNWKKESLGLEDEIEDSKYIVKRVVMEEKMKVLTIEDIAEATKQDPTLSSTP